MRDVTERVRARHYLRRILAGVHQLRELSDGLLSLATLARASPRSKPVDLSALALTAMAACRERAPQRCAEVTIAPGLVVQGDPRLLAHVVDNLVGNAWKPRSSSRSADHVRSGIVSLATRAACCPLTISPRRKRAFP